MVSAFGNFLSGGSRRQVLENSSTKNTTVDKKAPTTPATTPVSALYVNESNRTFTSTHAATLSEDELDTWNEALRMQIRVVEEQREKIKIQREKNRVCIRQVGEMSDKLTRHLNKSLYNHAQTLTTHTTLKTLHTLTLKHFQSLQSLNVTNDVFFIWHTSKFATINGLRIGKLTHPNTNHALVEWNEINAALGTAALLIATLLEKLGSDLKSKWKIIPSGNFSKVTKLAVDGTSRGGTSYNLYSDGSFSIFGKPSFNIALKGLLYCLLDLSNYIESVDRAMALPYAIEIDNESKVCAIGGVSVLMGSDEEAWNKAMKFFMCDLKWVVGFCCKHVDC